MKRRNHGKQHRTHGNRKALRRARRPMHGHRKTKNVGWGTQEWKKWDTSNEWKTTTWGKYDDMANKGDDDEDDKRWKKGDWDDS